MNKKILGFKGTRAWRKLTGVEWGGWIIKLKVENHIPSYHSALLLFDLLSPTSNYGKNNGALGKLSSF